MLKLLHFTAKLCVLCPMLIGVVLSVNGSYRIACVSAVRILYELYKVKWQSASPPVTVDLKETQTLNTYYWLRIVFFFFFKVSTVSEIGVT